MNILNQIKQALQIFFQKTYSVSDRALQSCEIQLNVDAQKQQFGDITTNAALILAKELKQQPRIIAQEIYTHFKNQWIERIEIAGPGFINIFLTEHALQELVRELYQQKASFFKLDPETQKATYNIEYVSANPTGPLHIGHGRGGILGDVLGNILRFLGHKVTKEFYINDAGSQIQKLGMSFKIRCQQQLGLSVELPEDAYHGDYLVQLAQEYIKTHGHQALDHSDAFFAQYAKEQLLKRIQKTLSNYGVHFDVWFSEQILHNSGAINHALAFLQQQSYIYEKDAALWFASIQFGDDKDRVVKKSSGELTYAAADIAYLKDKIERGADHIILILGQDHHGYVNRLKAVLQALGYTKERLDIIIYQLVTLKESGQQLRMSKRAGRIVTLEDVIDTVGTDVARFFYLNKKADAHLDFDIDLALKKTDENPVYYVQYAYVRTRSILQKAEQEEHLSTITDSDSTAISESEKLLIKKIVSLKELLISMSQNNQTHLLTYYVIELAQLFHRYYGNHKVINTAAIPQSRARLLLITLLRDTFKVCFDLLGISSPERM